MPVKITIKNNYILVEPRTNGYWEILEAFGKLFQMPEYLDKNTIWVMPEGPIEGSYDDLYKFRDFAAKNYPKSAKQENKSAIVVKTGLLRGLVDLWAKIAEDMPYEIKVFSDIRDAKKWLGD
jgi:hypothetical protein